MRDFRQPSSEVNRVQQQFLCQIGGLRLTPNADDHGGLGEVQEYLQMPPNQVVEPAQRRSDPPGSTVDHVMNLRV